MAQWNISFYCDNYVFATNTMSIYNSLLKACAREKNFNMQTQAHTMQHMLKNEKPK